MNYWIVKSEPGVYSWDKFEAEGSAVWDGIRSYAARLHLKAMKKNDQVLFYHSNAGKEIVGIAQVSREHYHDPSAGEEDWVAVDLKPLKRLKLNVTLSQVKKDNRLSKIALVTIPRLSVMPIKAEEFSAILELGS